MPRVIQTTGNRGLDEEIDRLYREIDALRSRVVQVPVASVPDPVPTLPKQIEVREADGSPDLFVDGVEVDETMSVSASGSLALLSNTEVLTARDSARHGIYATLDARLEALETRVWECCGPSPPLDFLPRYPEESLVRAEIIRQNISTQSEFPAVFVAGNDTFGGGGGVDMGAIATLQADANWYYKMETLAFVDSGPNSQDLTYTDPPGTGNDATITTGKISDCVAYPNSDIATILHADSTYFDFSATSFVIAGWVYLTDVSTSHYFVSKGDGSGAGTNYWFYSPGGSNGLNFTCRNTSSTLFEVNWPSALTANTWTFIEGGIDLTAGVIYCNVNNGTRVTTAFTGTLRNTAVDCHFFRAFAGGGALNGRMDEIGSWKRLWTAAERASIWNGGAGYGIF